MYRSNMSITGVLLCFWQHPSVSLGNSLTLAFIHFRFVCCDLPHVLWFAVVCFQCLFFHPCSSFLLLVLYPFSFAPSKHFSLLQQTGGITYFVGLSPACLAMNPGLQLDMKWREAELAEVLPLPSNRLELPSNCPSLSCLSQQVRTSYCLRSSVRNWMAPVEKNLSRPYWLMNTAVHWDHLKVRELPGESVHQSTKFLRNNSAWQERN